MDEKILKIQHTLKKELDENRYHHTLGVMYTSASMAMRYDVDVQKALYAGLLHDCAKCIPVSIATAIFPKISKAIADRNIDEARKDLRCEGSLRSVRGLRK